MYTLSTLWGQMIDTRRQSEERRPLNKYSFITEREREALWREGRTFGTHLQSAANFLMKKKHVLLPLLSPPTPQRSSRYLLITLNYLFIVQAVALSSIY
jgi:hypothetical protein